jgi:uncharacterized spore protein YtfJ
MTTAQNDTKLLAALRDMVDGATASRVFGEPITQGGSIVLPVAKVAGGAGGGTGTGGTSGDAGTGGEGREGREGSGAGGGVGLSATPLGVFVIRDGKASWQPAFDLNRVILGGQLVAIAALLVVRALIKARRKD